MVIALGLKLWISDVVVLASDLGPQTLNGELRRGPLKFDKKVALLQSI